MTHYSVLETSPRFAQFQNRSRVIPDMNSPANVFPLSRFTLISPTYAVLHVHGICHERIGFRIEQMLYSKNGVITLLGMNKRGKVKAKACLNQKKGKSFIEYP